MAALSSSVAIAMQQQHEQQEQHQQEAEGGLEVLEADLAELENSVYHLVRSNVEIAQFLGEAPGDKDLEQAQEENKVVLTKKRHRVKALRNAIADLKMYHPHLKGAASRTNPQIRTPPEGFHAAGGGGGIAASGSIGGAGASGGGGFGGGAGGAGVRGTGFQGVGGAGAVVVGAGEVQDIANAVAGSMRLNSPASATTAVGSGAQYADNALPGTAAGRVVEVGGSSRDSGDGGGGSGGGGGGSGSVTDGSGGVIL